MLSLIVFLPVLGALLCLVVPKPHVRTVAVLAAGATLVVSLFLVPTFLHGGSNPADVFGNGYGKLHHVERAAWIQGDEFTIEYFLGVDGVGFPLVILTTVISFLACLASWNFDTWKINRGVRAYFSLFLLLETGMLGVFVSLDFFLFYVFWEVMLLPMYFLIGVWGGPRREYAAIKFFLFTLAGSVLMLVALVAMYLQSGAAIHEAMEATSQPGVASAYRDATLTGGTFDLIEMAVNPVIQKHFASGLTRFLDFRFAPVMFIFLFIGFAIKLPIVPLHTWLPDAHVEAPTPISMILAGVLLKMGGYGFLRLCYPIFPTAAKEFALLLAVIGVVSILYGALCAMAQTDFKKLVAYSSVSHMGYVLLGLAVLTKSGFGGAMFQMLAHGVSSPMCFFLVGVIYERAHHREINRFGGLWLTMPKYGTMATIGFFASLGLPALCGFIGEFWVVMGTFEARSMFTWAPVAAVLAAAGVILTAGYILWLIRRVYLGPERDEYRGYSDASAREMGIMIPMAILAIVMGILPMQTVFNYTTGTLNNVLKHVVAMVS
ncbi:MAG TPA: NADH-quinone oxidoreductase subunit M [Phycisphaerae bacterium]|nr:NADH-quinone oxidoreductase subunit M [Phycisphaerae bacterium]HNU46607.1 NADH-quinone oxidoreductase subunit M [Phycisphaerae bacterium]